MTIRLLLALLGTAQAANGLTMLAAPMGWYAAMPGVAMTGPFNSHFVRDIGLIFLASGAALMLSARTGRDAAVLAAAGAAWPAMHGLFHVYGWITHGFPADPATAVTEAVGVVFAAALGAALAWFRMKQKQNTETLLPSQHPVEEQSSVDRLLGPSPLNLQT